jgi:hypothetical protein
MVMAPIRMARPGTAAAMVVAKAAMEAKAEKTNAAQID